MSWKYFEGFCRPIPQRFVLATMIMLGLAVQYTNRITFVLALTFIAYKGYVPNKKLETHCEFSAGKSYHSLMAEFFWTSYDQANILGAFYFGYIISHLPGGIVSDWCGPKKVMGVCLFTSGVCVLLTPFSARLMESIWPLCVNRFVIGLTEGTVFPSMSAFIARWSLPSERNMMSSYINLGVSVGGIYSILITGFLINKFDCWDVIFYFYGVSTIFFSIVWYLITYEDPANHPYITEEERVKIKNALEGQKSERFTRMPISALFKFTPVWAMIAGNIGHDLNNYFLITMMPEYFQYALHMDILDFELSSYGPFIMIILLATLSALLSEIFLKKGWLSKTKQCKIWLAISNTMPGVLVLIGTFAGCSRMIAVFCFTLACGFQGFAFASIRVVNVDMAPNYAGRLMALMNGLGGFFGMILPQNIALLEEQQTVAMWRIFFLFIIFLTALSTLFFITFGSTELQPWNKPISPSTSIISTI